MVRPQVSSIFVPPADVIAQFQTDGAKVEAMRIWRTVVCVGIVSAAVAAVAIAVVHPILLGAGGSLAGLAKFVQSIWPK